MPAFGIEPRNPDDFTPSELRLLTAFNNAMRECTDAAAQQNITLPCGLLNKSGTGKDGHRWWILAAKNVSGTTAMNNTLEGFLASLARPLRAAGLSLNFSAQEVRQVENA
jgi:hypothetical protein